MDLYDVGRDGGDDFWLEKITAPLLFIGIRTDWLFPPNEVKDLSDHLVNLGKDSVYAEIDSPHGHDAFLKEWDQLEAIIGPFVQRAIVGAARP
jgi:homoserine O-acetyltransferase